MPRDACGRAALPTNDPLRPLEHGGFGAVQHVRSSLPLLVNCDYTASGLPSGCRLQTAHALTTWACCRWRTPSEQIRGPRNALAAAAPGLKTSLQQGRGPGNLHDRVFCVGEGVFRAPRAGSSSDQRT